MAASRLELAIGKISQTSIPVIDRACRAAADNRHDLVYVEHLLAAIILEERATFENKGYSADPVYKACLAKWPEFNIVHAPVPAENLPPSSRLTEWIDGARKVARQRVSENQTITLEDFFESVRGDAELRAFPELEKVRRLLQYGASVSTLKPLSAIATEGFREAKGQVDRVATDIRTDNKTIQQKLDAVSSKLDGLLKAITPIGPTVATLHSEIKEFRAETKKGLNDLKKDTDQAIRLINILLTSLPNVTKGPDPLVRKSLLSLFIGGAIVFGVLGGYTARLQFAIF